MVADETLDHPEPGLNLAISVSESPDLHRLGLTGTHLKMALGELSRAVLVAHGTLVYGGHLDPGGFTPFLIHECEKYGSRNRPFTGAIPLPMHRAVHLDELAQLRKDINLFGRYEFLDVNGRVLEDHTEGRGPEPEETDPETTGLALTNMRDRVTARTDGRIVLGGKRDGYLGRMQGLVEEALLSMRTQKPLYLAGGFGGSAGDIVGAVGLDPRGWLALPSPERDNGLTELFEASRDWDPTSNGLSLDQNRQLAVSYRASEIASLVITGLINLRGN